MQQSNVSLVIAFRMGDRHVVGTHAAPPHWQALNELKQSASRRTGLRRRDSAAVRAGLVVSIR
jgi:hypothetical protein